MSYTTTALLDNIKRRAMIPTNQVTFLDTDLMSIANDEMSYGILPLIMSVREEYYVKTYDVTMTVGQDNYSIPPRAIGGKLRDVVIIQGNQTNHLYYYNPDKVEYNLNNQSPYAFYFKGNEIITIPKPSAADTLRMTYFARPSEIVAVSTCSLISATAASSVTVGSVPTNITTSTLVDIVKATPHFDIWGIDQTISSTASTTITFASSTPSNVAVGDYVALAEQTPIPQLPKEFHSILAQRVAIRVLDILGDPQVDALITRLKVMEEGVQKLINPRVDGVAKKITSNDNIINYVNGLRYKAYY